MYKEFINYNQALKLKELGFDEECFGVYIAGQLMITNDSIYNSTDIPVIKIPTFSQAFRWFRDTHNLIHEIQIDRTSDPKFCYAILQYEHYGNYEEIRIREWYLYRTYEEAELACLETLIEVVESKSE